MVIKTLFVNTMPRRLAEETVTQEGGVLRAKGTPKIQAPEWNPHQELESEERLHRRMAQYHQAEDSVPTGMEGNYFL